MPNLSIQIRGMILGDGIAQVQRMPIPNPLGSWKRTLRERRRPGPNPNAKALP
jgi:hypothetical protein